MMKTVKLDLELIFLIKDVSGAKLKFIDGLVSKLDLLFKERKIKYRLKESK